MKPPSTSGSYHVTGALALDLLPPASFSLSVAALSAQEGRSEHHSHSFCLTGAVWYSAVSMSSACLGSWWLGASQGSSTGLWQSLQTCSSPASRLVSRGEWGRWGWSGSQNWLPLWYRVLKALGILNLHSSTQHLSGQHSPLQSFVF